MDFKKWFSKEAFSGKHFKFGGFSVFSSILVLLIAVFLVLAVGELPVKLTKLDVTTNKLYTLSKDTERLVKSLENDVNIYFIAPVGETDSVIDKMIEKYDDLSGKVHTKKIDPGVNPTFTQKYTQDTVTSSSIIVESGEKNIVLQYMDLYNVEYTSDTSADVEYDGERVLTNAIRYVTGAKAPKIYVTTGHGEMQIGEKVKDAVKKSNVEFDSLNLLTSQSIPEDAVAIVIYEPGQDISDYERDLLDGYMKAGGNLILFTGYSGLSFPNIEAVIAPYGVKMGNALVCESDSTMYARGHNYNLVPNQSTHTIMNPILNQGLFNMVVAAEPIILTGEESSTVELTQLLTTSDKAFTKNTNIMATEYAEGDPTGQYTVGISAVDRHDEIESHLLWISGIQFLDDQIDNFMVGANSDLFVNTINWMHGTEDNISIRPKAVAQDRVLIMSSQFVNIYSIIFVFVIPVLVIILGVIVWIRRKSR